MLGSAFARSAKRRGHAVTGLTGRQTAPVEGLKEQIQVDLRDLSEVERIVLEQFPDAIVNCAASSEVSQCESDPQSTRTLNVDLPEKLALLARHLFATVIHISSEQVFDGKKELYHPEDDPSPTNEYARQKRESEKKVHDLAAEFATTLRLPLLMGNSPRGDRSFHERLFQSWSNGQATSLFVDEIRQPCLSDNAADAMVELCERNDLKGIYSWAGKQALTRFEMGQATLQHFGLPDSLITQTRRGDDPRFAQRQPSLVFDLSPLAGKMKTQPQSFQQQLDALVVPPACRSWYNAV